MAATTTALHKPLPDLPAPEGLFRSTILSAQARRHRGRLLRHFLHDLDQPEPALTNFQDAWIAAVEHALDDAGKIIVRQDWLSSVRKGKVVKESRRKATAASLATASTAPQREDKPLPELDPLLILRKLASIPKDSSKKPRPGHLVLCIAPHRGGDLPAEDSGFDLVPATVDCLFKAGRFNLESGSVLYGLQGISSRFSLQSAVFMLWLIFFSR